MIQTILGFFGYTKIPLAAVQLSLMQEGFLQKMLEHETSDKGREYLAKFLCGQKTLTSFLRSGKLLGVE